jgi:hypothetical protein
MESQGQFADVQQSMEYIVLGTSEAVAVEIDVKSIALKCRREGMSHR